jgi:hypothetical protein
MVIFVGQNLVNMDHVIWINLLKIILPEHKIGELVVLICKDFNCKTWKMTDIWILSK